MQAKIVIGLALTLVILVFIPVYWVTEPGRQAAARERFLTAAKERGAELFTSHCAVCHGASGQGKIGPALKGIALDENTLIKTTSRGVAGTAMPAFATEEGGPLAQHQVQDVVTFILNWDSALLSSANATPTPMATHAPTSRVTPTAASTPTTTSSPSPPLTPTETSTPTMTVATIDTAALYAANCALCHGDNRLGVPNLGPALTPEYLASMTDAEIRDTIANGRITKGMPPWQTVLTPDEIDALVQFVK